HSIYLNTFCGKNIPTKFSFSFCRFSSQPYFCAGEMAERSNAAVLKTVEVKASGGSNPSLSAEPHNKLYFQQVMRFFYAKGKTFPNGFLKTFLIFYRQVAL